MNRRNTKLKKIFSMPMVSAFVVLFIVISVMNFAKQNLDISGGHNQGKLQECALYTAEFINQTMSGAVDTVKNTAKMYSVFSDVTSEQAIKMNDQIINDIRFQRIRITNASGMSYAGNGTCLDLSQREYFKDAMKGNSGITNALTSMTGEHDIVIVYEPIRHEDKVIGMAQGVYETKEISKAMDLKSFDGEGYFVIFQQDGKMIINTGNEKSIVYGGDNLWSILKGINYKNGSSYLELRQNISDGKSGFITYSSKNTTVLAYYMPVGIKNWYVLQLVPQDVVSSYSTRVNYFATLMVIKIVVALLILGVFIIKKERRYQNIILNANRDVKTITDAIPGGVQKCTYDEKCEFLYISQGFIDMTGYGREEILVRFDNRFINMVYFEDVEKIQKQLSAYKGEGYIDFEYRIERKDGNIIWVADRCNLVNEDGNKLYFYCVVMDITKEKNAHRERQISNKKFKIAMGHLSCTVFEYDPINNLVYNTDETVIKYKIPSVFTGGPKEIIERKIVDKDYEDVCMDMFKRICCGENAASCVVIGHRKDKSYWWKITLTAVLDEEGKSIWAVGTIEDITKLKEIEERFAKEEQYRELFMADAVLIHEVNVTRDEVRVRGRGGSSKKSPAVSYSDICKKLINKYVHIYEREMVANMFSAKNLIKVLEHENGEHECEIRCKARNGKEFWVSAVSHMLKDPETSDILCYTYMRNIQNRKEKELKLKHSAERDVLTNLYNRAVSQRRIENFLKQLVEGEIHAFLIIDIDNFKHINDKFGHMQGDSILIGVAGILKDIFRKEDIVARLGGDEFVIFMKNAGSARLIEEKARLLCKRVATIEIIESGEQNLSASVGIALVPKDGTTYEQLYKASDIALYKVKGDGRNGYKFFDK